MSIRSVCTFRNLSNVNKLSSVSFTSLNNYSRRSNSDDGPYKVVVPKKALKDVASNIFGDPNVDILVQSKGFPFFLPGNVGPAWQNKYSTIQHEKIVMKYIPKAASGNVICQIQECPRVLHQTVCELFPNTGLENLELSVITLTLKSNLKMIRYNNEIETEKLAQSFLLAANNICQKLRKVGYWADFINPFSGRPYIQVPHGDSNLYEADEKFRCLDFQIFSINNCKIITNEDDKRSAKKFVGSLFTSAPSKKSQIQHVFSDRK